MMCALAAFGLFVTCSDGRADGRTLYPWIDQITTQQGLSNDYVLCVYQDRMGFLWCGTHDGLNRYDGNTFRQYRHDPADPSSIGDVSVGCIYEDRRGNLWFGTHSDGLDLYDRVNDRFIHHRHDPNNPRSIGGGRVIQICEDDDGNLWVATSDLSAGVSVLDPRTGLFTVMLNDPGDRLSLSSNSVVGVCRDSAGTIWVGTRDGGLNRYDPTLCGFINRNTIPAYGHTIERMDIGLHADASGEIWLIDRGVYRMFDCGTANIRRFRTSLAPEPPLNSFGPVFRDRSGMLWIGTSVCGVVVIDPRARDTMHFTYEPGNRYSFSSPRVFCVHEDITGNIWIGTEKGLNKLNRRRWQFRHYLHRAFDTNSITASVVRSIHIDERKSMWLATAGGGINRIDSGSPRIVTLRPGSEPTSLSDYTINIIYKDRGGTLWFGTNRGLNRLLHPSGTFRRYVHSSDTTTLAEGGIWDILEDRRGNFWVAVMDGGLNLLDRTTGNVRHYRHSSADPASVGHDRVLCLHEARDGTLWVGTDNGLDRFDPVTRKFRHYVSRPSDTSTLSNNRIWFIHEDARGMLWIGTSGGGLNRFDPTTGKCRRFMEDRGLANNTVGAIVEDRRGYLWISTGNGLSRFDPRTETFRNYLAEDGLAVNVFHFKSCCTDEQGNIYFGGRNGIVRFHPDSLDDNRLVPPLRFTAFSTLDSSFRLDSSIVVKQSIELEHDNNFFTIEFSALDFTNPANNTLHYMLEGFDEHWRITSGARPVADYTNVPPGIYTFRLIGANSDGIWNRQGISLAVVVNPAFWQTWWFTVLCVLVALAGTAAIVLARIRNVRRKGRLERQMVEYQLQALRAQMNPHFIFNSLNSILHFVVGHDSESAHRYLTKFARLMRATMDHSKRDTITLAEELNTLHLYLELESLRMDSQVRYEINVGPDINIEETEIPPMLIQPYVENAIKHGLAHRREPGGKVTIAITATPTHLKCSVTDNGVGRARVRELQQRALHDHRSYGMEITRNRMDVLYILTRQHYSVEVTDLVDPDGTASGTRVDLHIPLSSTEQA